jgi:hypothetical protein
VASLSDVDVLLDVLLATDSGVRYRSAMEWFLPVLSFAGGLAGATLPSLLQLRGAKRTRLEDAYAELAGCGALLLNLSIPNLFGDRQGVDQAWVSFEAIYARVLLRERDPGSVVMLKAYRDKLKDLYSYTVYLESPRSKEEDRSARSLAHMAKMKIVECEFESLIQHARNYLLDRTSREKRMIAMGQAPENGENGIKK